MSNPIVIKEPTLNFFAQIGMNNNKDWFEKNKPLWEAVKDNYAAFMASVQEKIVEIDTIVVKEPKKYVSRINRDFRFTPDKSPYRTNIWSLIERNADEKMSRFYIQIEPGNSYIAAGLWSPEPDILKKVRREIVNTSSELHPILNAPSFKAYFDTITGEALSRPPKDFDATSPNVELLKLKQYLLKKNFSDEEVLSPDFSDAVLVAYKEALPFLVFLDATIGE
jgi:uncharacterized protein (TIGR02453 family)